MSAEAVYERLSGIRILVSRTGSSLWRNKEAKKAGICYNDTLKSYDGHGPAVEYNHRA